MTKLLLLFVLTIVCCCPVGYCSSPTFGEEPEDVHIVRSIPAYFKCKTEHALSAWFECSSGDPKSIQRRQTGHNYVDPATGIRIIELQLEVTRKDIEDYKIRLASIAAQLDTNFAGGHVKKHSSQTDGKRYQSPPAYECWCHAYGGHQNIVSRKATVTYSLNDEWTTTPVPRQTPHTVIFKTTRIPDKRKKKVYVSTPARATNDQQTTSKLIKGGKSSSSFISTLV